MNYTQLYKRANMRKVTTPEQLYKIAYLLKRAEQDVNLGSYSQNPHTINNFDSISPNQKKQYLRAPNGTGVYKEPLFNSYFSQLIKENPNIVVPHKGADAPLGSRLHPASVQIARYMNADRAFGIFGIPDSLRIARAIKALGRKVGKTHKQRIYNETGAVPAEMSPELDKEYHDLTDKIPLREGQTIESRKQKWYKQLSDANKRGRHSNVG